MQVLQCKCDRMPKWMDHIQRGQWCDCIPFNRLSNKTILTYMLRTLHCSGLRPKSTNSLEEPAPPELARHHAHPHFRHSNWDCLIFSVVIDKLQACTYRIVSFFIQVRILIYRALLTMLALMVAAMTPPARQAHTRSVVMRSLHPLVCLTSSCSRALALWCVVYVYIYASCMYVCIDLYMHACINILRIFMTWFHVGHQYVVAQRRLHLPDPRHLPIRLFQDQ